MTTAATSAAPPVMPVATATVPAIRSVAMRFPYDSHVDGEASLRGNPDEVSAALKSEVQARLDVAGLEILEARLSHLAYAPEIAQSMLRRQQAEAIVAARGRIVEGAVGMVEMALPDGRRIIRLEGVGRVKLQRETPTGRGFRELSVVPLGEPLPVDLGQIQSLKVQVERLARYCAEDSEALLSLLTLRDDRVFLYSLTAFLPSLELLASDIRDWVHDDHLLVSLQQRSLAAEDADERARFLIERTTSILDRLGAPELYTGSMSN